MSFVVLLATLLLLYAVLRHGFAEIDRRLLPLPLALACLCLVMPNMVLGIWGLDFRYPFIALLLLISAVRLRPQARRAGAVRVAVVLVAAVALSGAAAQLSANDRKQQELREALRLAASGGALLTAGDYRTECHACFPEWIDQLHAGALAAIERQMFVPLLFPAPSFFAAAPEDRHSVASGRSVPVREDPGGRR